MRALCAAFPSRSRSAPRWWCRSSPGGSSTSSGAPAIAARLNADPGRYPAPGLPGWTAQLVHVILRNPKYTGHMVFGRRRTRNGRRVQAPPRDWLWSPEPAHPALIDRATWDQAQTIGKEHATSRDGTGPGPGAVRFYPYRSRCRCRECRRRMAGRTYGPRAQSTYYRCPHDPANPRHAAASPEHPPTVQAPEKVLDRIVGEFFDTYVFGPGRAALVAGQLPVTQADADADRDATRHALALRLKQNETAKKAQITAHGHLPEDDPDTAAEMRTRIFDRFAELRAEREQLQAQLDALDTTTAQPADISLLDQLPLAANPLPRLTPSSRPCCSRPSTWRSCGTPPTGKPPSGSRSPTPPCGPSPPSSTLTTTATTTPTPALTSL